MGRDQNTKYYHLKTINIRWRNKSAMLKRNKSTMLKNDNGLRIEDIGWLKEMVNSFYGYLFALNYNWNIPERTDISFPSLHETDIQLLNAPINDEEVKKVVFAMKPWKAPCPDGFPVGLTKNLGMSLGEMCVIL